MIWDLGIRLVTYFATASANMNAYQDLVTKVIRGCNDALVENLEVLTLMKSSTII